MQMLNSPRPDEVNGMSTRALRQHFLIANLFVPGEVNLVCSDLDRMMIGGALPQSALQLPRLRELGTRCFTERREIGIINTGRPGVVRVGPERYELDKLECLYIGIEEPEVSFEACGAEQAEFFFLSCPAHRKCPTRKITPEEARVIELGDEAHSNKRRITYYIYPGGASSCQLTMGFTELAPNSIWNTMPPHMHGRRMEVYFYFDLEDGMVVHLMGSPQQTRHLVVRDRQAVLSPPWSIHAGAGTQKYRFIWGMAGENQDLGDLDPLPLSALL